MIWSHFREHNTSHAARTMTGQKCPTKTLRHGGDVSFTLSIYCHLSDCIRQKRFIWDSSRFQFKAKKYSHAVCEPAVHVFRQSSFDLTLGLDSKIASSYSHQLIPSKDVFLVEIMKLGLLFCSVSIHGQIIILATESEISETGFVQNESLLQR